MSARLPTSRVPRSSPRPSARAATLVVPANDSSGVKPNTRLASAIASRTELSGDVPGLQSVATAIGILCARISSTGGHCVSFNVTNAPGNKTATVPALLIARMPEADVYSR